MDHARRFVDESIARLGLGADSLIVEVASNDGYLLQHAVAAGVPCVGIEPSVNVGRAARERGVPTVTAFLGPETAAQVRAEYGPADLVVANNVYAHIPDLLGFTAGLRGLLADDGWLSIEVHHALALVAEGQFDTIYHEHFQYYTVLSAQRALATAGLTVVDVEDHPHPRRVDPRVGPAGRGGAGTVGARARGAADRGGGRPARPRGLRRHAGDGRPGPAGPAALPARAARRGSAGSSATAPPARATRCSTTAASGPTCSSTPWTGTPTNTADSRPARASPSTRRSASRTIDGRGRRAAVEPRDRDHRAVAGP